MNYKLKNTKFEHFYVGKCHSMDLQGDGTYIDVLSQRSSENDSPVFLGMMVTIICSNNLDTFFLGRVEQIKPDIATDMSLKESLRSSVLHKSEIDVPYKKATLFVSYKVKVLGVCNVNDDKITFVSNVRTLPSVLSMELCIPNSEVMKAIVKTATSESDTGSNDSLEIGYLQYGSIPEYTSKYYQIGSENQVPIYFNVSNLLRKRTGIFGKSGYGKSNTVKTALGMLTTQYQDLGILIFDTNGEYAMSNDQNDGFMEIFDEVGLKQKCILYTQRKVHDSKKEKFGKDCFKPLRFDVFENISASMDIIISNLNGQTIPMYLQSWVNECQGIDDQSLLFANVQNKGLAWGMWFKSCLDAGLKPLKEKTSFDAVQIKKEFLDELSSEYIENESVDESSDPVVIKFNNLNEEIQDQLLKDIGAYKTGKNIYSNNIETMANYAEWYTHDLKKKEKNDKKRGIDEDDRKTSSVKGYSELLGYSRRLYQLKGYNIGQENSDKKGALSLSLGENIWNDLLNKKVVIIDLASISANVSKVLTEQIASVLLSKASAMFGDYEQQDKFKNFDVVVFIEEAQNYLSTEQVSGGSGVFERLAKEGRKFHLGLVYITQQPSAIDQKITSQTENLIVMHLSNSGDTLMLNKIKDKFDLLTCRFLKDEAQKGLAYIYSEPHQPFVLQAQIHKFDKTMILNALKAKRSKL